MPHVQPLPRGIRKHVQTIVFGSWIRIRYRMHAARFPLPPPLLFDLLRFIRLVAHRSLTSLACPLLLTNIEHIYQISLWKVQRCLACHRHFCLLILGIFATVRSKYKRGTRTSAMLPPFEAILFDYDGTLAVLNLD